MLQKTQKQLEWNNLNAVCLPPPPPPVSLIYLCLTLYLSIALSFKLSLSMDTLTGFFYGILQKFLGSAWESPALFFALVSLFWHSKTISELAWDYHSHDDAAATSPRTWSLWTDDFSVAAACWPASWNGLWLKFGLHSFFYHHDSFNFVFGESTTMPWWKDEVSMKLPWMPLSSQPWLLQRKPAKQDEPKTESEIDADLEMEADKEK